MAFGGLLPANWAATHATRVTSVSEDKLASQLSKCWDVESYALNCDVPVHSKDEQCNQSIRANNSTHRWKKRSWVLWRENEVKLPIIICSAMLSLWNDAYRKMIRYESVNRKLLTLTFKLVMSVKSKKLNWTKSEISFNRTCHIILSSNLKNPKKSEECATQH